MDVSFRELSNRFHPKSHIGELRGLLPEKYSPLRVNGDGLQSVYLAEVGRPFAAALFRLITATRPIDLRCSRRQELQQRIFRVRKCLVEDRIAMEVEVLRLTG
jgi:hypothetical protein